MNDLEVIKKELFITKFCKKLGWNPNELSTNQLLVIIKEFKKSNVKT